MSLVDKSLLYDVSTHPFHTDFQSFNSLIDVIAEKTSSVDWTDTLCKVAVLAPTLLCSGAGWTIGFALGGPLGAGAGDMIGTFVGSVLSIGIELLIEKYVKGNQELETGSQIWEFVRPRLKQAAISSCGSLLGGMIFAPAMQWTSKLVVGNCHLLQAVATGGMTTLTYTGGVTAARATYTAMHNLFNFEKDKDYEELECSWEHFKNDFKQGAIVTFPAETAFVATALMGPVLAPLKAAAAVCTGGTTGFVISHIATSQETSKDSPPSLKLVEVPAQA